MDYENLVHVLKESPDFILKKSSLEQLLNIISEPNNGKKLYRSEQAGQDVFSFCLEEALNIYAHSLENGINLLSASEMNYMSEIVRFIILSCLLYQDE